LIFEIRIELKKVKLGQKLKYQAKVRIKAGQQEQERMDWKSVR
jgi:hypothetical protein